MLMYIRNFSYTPVVLTKYETKVLGLCCLGAFLFLLFLSVYALLWFLLKTFKM